MQAPTTLQSRINIFGRNVEVVAKIRKARRYAIDGFYAIVPTIAILLLPCGPHNVGRAITSGIIKAFNRPSLFTNPHISQEVLESFPARTKGDASPAVVVKVVAFGVCAARFHGRPNAIDSGSLKPVREQWFIGSHKTTTRASSATSEAGVSGGLGTTTIASADISPNLIAGWGDVGGCFRNDNQPSKSAADHVYCIRHNGGRSLFMFSGGRHGYNRALAMHCNGWADK